MVLTAGRGHGAGGGRGEPLFASTTPAAAGGDADADAVDGEGTDGAADEHAGGLSAPLAAQADAGGFGFGSAGAAGHVLFALGGVLPNE